MKKKKITEIYWITTCLDKYTFTRIKVSEKKYYYLSKRGEWHKSGENEILKNDCFFTVEKEKIKPLLIKIFEARQKNAKLHKNVNKLYAKNFKLTKKCLEKIKSSNTLELFANRRIGLYDENWHNHNNKNKTWGEIKWIRGEE